jgi:N-acetylglucosamine kinase-like BadF-type ATPase
VVRPKAVPIAQTQSQICDSISSWRIFDAIDGSGRSRISVWIDREKIGKREIGQLNQKIDMLARSGSELGPQLLAGPVKSKKNKKAVPHIYKLRLNGDQEFTLLLGAIEINSVLDTDPEDAEAIRLGIIADENTRKPHERYK